MMAILSDCVHMKFEMEKALASIAQSLDLNGGFIVVGVKSYAMLKFLIQRSKTLELDLTNWLEHLPFYVSGCVVLTVSDYNNLRPAQVGGFIFGRVFKPFKQQ